MTSPSETDHIAGIVEVSERSVEEKIRDFSTLLKTIETLDDKKRQLWKEVYENSVSDRQNSYVMFTKLVRICKDDTTQHAVHGKTIATYIERMSRSNDQLIKLAELISKAQNGSESIDPEDMFSKIRGH